MLSISFCHRAALAAFCAASAACSAASAARSADSWVEAFLACCAAAWASSAAFCASLAVSPVGDNDGDNVEMLEDGLAVVSSVRLWKAESPIPWSLFSLSSCCCIDSSRSRRESLGLCCCHSDHSVPSLRFGVALIRSLARIVSPFSESEPWYCPVSFLIRFPRFDLVWLTSLWFSWNVSVGEPVSPKELGPCNISDWMDGCSDWGELLGLSVKLAIGLAIEGATLGMPVSYEEKSPVAIASQHLEKDWKKWVANSGTYNPSFVYPETLRTFPDTCKRGMKVGGDNIGVKSTPKSTISDKVWMQKSTEEDDFKTCFNRGASAASDDTTTEKGW